MCEIQCKCIDCNNLYVISDCNCPKCKSTSFYLTDKGQQDLNKCLQERKDKKISIGVVEKNKFKDYPIFTNLI